MVRLYEGDAFNCDQFAIEDMAKNGEVTCIFEGSNAREVLDWLIQAMNDEELDIVNNFHCIIYDN